MSDVREFPVKFEHDIEHKIFHDQLVKILCDFNDVFINNLEIPKIDKYNVDLSKIPINFFLNWVISEAQSLKHSHKE